LEGLGEGAALAVAVAAEQSNNMEEEEEPEPAQSGFLALQPAHATERNAEVAERIAVSNAPGTGAMVVLEDKMLADRVKNVLEDAAVRRRFTISSWRCTISASATSLSRE